MIFLHQKRNRWTRMIGKSYAVMYKKWNLLPLSLLLNIHLNTIEMKEYIDISIRLMLMNSILMFWWSEYILIHDGAVLLKYNHHTKMIGIPVKLICWWNYSVGYMINCRHKPFGNWAGVNTSSVLQTQHLKVTSISRRNELVPMTYILMCDIGIIV